MYVLVSARGCSDFTMLKKDRSIYRVRLRIQLNHYQMSLCINIILINGERRRRLLHEHIRANKIINARSLSSYFCYFLFVRMARSEDTDLGRLDHACSFTNKYSYVYTTNTCTHTFQNELKY